MKEKISYKKKFLLKSVFFSQIIFPKLRLILKNSISLQNDFRNIISNKMKIHFLVISLGFIFSVYAQNTASKNNPPILETEAVATTLTSEGKKVFVGNILSDNDVFITFCDDNDKPIWYLPIKTNKVEKATAVALAKNGDIMVAGTVSSDKQAITDAWVACVSAVGKLKWTKVWGMERQTRISAITATNDGNFCLVGYTNNQLTKNDGWVCKMNPAGNEIWSKTFGWDKTDEFMACTERKNGNLLLAGFTDSKGAGLKDMLLVEMDSEGAVSWLRVYGKANGQEEATAVAETPTQQIVLCGRSNEKNPNKADTDGRVLLLDETGKINWSEIQGGINMDSYFSIACKAESFAIVGTTIPENAQNTQAWGLSYDYNGKKLWEKKWENNIYFSHISPTKSGWCISATQEKQKQLSANIVFIDNQGELEKEISSEQWLAEKEVVVEIEKPKPTKTAEIAISEEENLTANADENVITPTFTFEEDEDDLPQNSSEMDYQEDDMSIEALTKLAHQADKDSTDKHIETEMLELTTEKMTKNEVAFQSEEPKEKEGIIVKKNGDEIEILSVPPTKEEKVVMIAPKSQAKEMAIEKPENQAIPIENNVAVADTDTVLETKIMVQNVYVLGVGISSYQNKKYDIRYAASDAELFSLSMTGMEGNGFGKVKVQIYTNEEAVLDNIQNAIRNIASQAQENDLICIYLAGRGYYNNDGVPYLMMNNESEGADSNNSASLNLYSLVDSLEKMKGEKVLMTDFFIDPAISYTTIKWSREIIGNDICFLSSITEDEIALEKTEWGHSAFAKNLLEGLGGKADADKNSFIYFSELTQFMNEEVPSLTHDLQHPQVILSPKQDVILGVYRE